MRIIRKARKDYECDKCKGIIRKGNSYIHYSERFPKYNHDETKQIGIEYFNSKTCKNEMCDGVLKYAFDYKNVLKKCNKGKCKYEEIKEFDHYAGTNRVDVPTGKYICIYCNKIKKNY